MNKLTKTNHAAMKGLIKFGLTIAFALLPLSTAMAATVYTDFFCTSNAEHYEEPSIYGQSGSSSQEITYQVKGTCEFRQNKPILSQNAPPKPGTVVKYPIKYTATLVYKPTARTMSQKITLYSHQKMYDGDSKTAFTTGLFERSGSCIGPKDEAMPDPYLVDAQMSNDWSCSGGTVKVEKRPSFYDEFNKAYATVDDDDLKDIGNKYSAAAMAFYRSVEKPPLIWAQKPVTTTQITSFANNTEFYSKVPVNAKVENRNPEVPCCTVLFAYKLDNKFVGAYSINYGFDRPSDPGMEATRNTLAQALEKRMVAENYPSEKIKAVRDSKAKGTWRVRVIGFMGADDPKLMYSYAEKDDFNNFQHKIFKFADIEKVLTGQMENEAIKDWTSGRIGGQKPASESAMSSKDRFGAMNNNTARAAAEAVARNNKSTASQPPRPATSAPKINVAKVSMTPSLSVASFTASSLAPKAGERLTLTMRIKNTGQADSAANHKVKLLCKATSGSCPVSNGDRPINAVIKTNGSHDFKLVTSPLEPGNYELTAIADGSRTAKQLKVTVMSAAIKTLKGIPRK